MRNIDYPKLIWIILIKNILKPQSIVMSTDARAWSPSSSSDAGLIQWSWSPLHIDVIKIDVDAS